MPYARTRLGRWFYEERGSLRRPGDPTIFLLHSLLCDGGMWRHQLDPLAGLGRVVVVDAPGHGRSEVPPPFTLEDHAAALVDLYGETGTEKAVVVGLSWGGMVALRLALASPERVRAMALFDTSAEEVPFAEKVRFRAMISLARRFGLPPGLVERQICPLMFASRTRREQPELVTSFARTMNGYPREGVARASLAVAIRRSSVVDRLSGVRTPTLVACGREDRATPPGRSQTIADRIPGARMVWIEDAGHLSALERPEAANASLVPFVREALSRA